MTRTRDARIRWTAGVAAVMLLAAALRLDALTSKYGRVSTPAWARVLTTSGAAAGRHLHPARLAWPPVPNPYVGGDPYTYLKFAREMRSFYQAHVREPVFLALTRAFLWRLSDRDVAISFASAFGSTLMVLATYLLGAAAFSRWVGLAAALAIAVDFQAIDLSVDGWRDDTVACTFTLAAWALVRLRRRPSIGNAVLAGVMSALACLSRITALVFVIPALVWLGIDASGAPRAARIRASAAALLVAGVLVAPYLINCARETGDPLISINYHTRFYRFGEGLPSDKPMSATAYVGSKVRNRPVAAVDTATTGIFVWPLDSKGGGLDLWVPGVRILFLVCTSAGLILFLTTGTGRLLLVVLFSSLLPYAFTWNVRGGGEWRFTLHAYPLYLVAAGSAVAALVGWAVATAKTRTVPRSSRKALAIALAGAAAAAVGFGAYRQLPYYVVREAVGDGVPASVMVGDRDDPFFASGWSEAHAEGANVWVRVSIDDRGVISLPLPDARAYDLVLRLDPVAPAAQSTFVALLNGRMLGRNRFTWDPQRVGYYRITVPAELVRPGANRLQLIAEPGVPAATVRDRYPWLPPSADAGVRFWYVRIEPR